MTRLLTTGWETGDVAESGTSTGSTITVASSTPTPRGGAYCLKLAGAASWANCYKTFSLSAAKTEVWLRFAFYLHNTSTTPVVPFAQLNDSANGAQLTLTHSATDSLVRLYRGTYVGTVIATSSSGFTQDAWHVIEWRAQILTATTGASEVWIDGNQVINFSGDTTNTANLNVQNVLLGNTHSIGLSGASTTYFAYDDFAVNDTSGSVNNGRLGDGRVVLLSPTGNGTTIQFVRGGTDTGANWSQVSELPPSLTQYVASPTVGNRDLYTLADLPVAVTSINVVEVIALAQNSDAGGGSLALTLKSGAAAANEATAIALSTSAAYITSRWETNPDGSVAWTAAAVNALEAGATVR